MWVNVYLVITVALLCAYGALMLMYRRWFMQLHPFKPQPGKPHTTFSIIIPARDEAGNIAVCLRSVLQQKYPKELFEVIVVDDHSADATPEIVRQWQAGHPNLKLIRLSQELHGAKLNSYKKKAIELAIGRATGNWILTTDADCVARDEWLLLYDSFITEYDPVFVAAPVVFTAGKSWPDIFQAIDFMALQGITMASVTAGFHDMCNGANLGYRKDVFYSVNGFRGIDDIASGDDMLLMNKIRKKYPRKVKVLFSQGAVVATAPMPGWGGFFQQRIRWASKAGRLSDKRIIAVLAFVYLLNLALLVMPFLCWWSPALLGWWLVALVLKTVLESTFAVPLAHFFGLKLRWWFPVLQLIHIPYIVWAGFAGAFGTYKWKGRKVK